MVLQPEILFSKIAQFREEGKFTDVRLKSRDTIFPAHRVLLAAYSDYFYAMFTDGMMESNQQEIELKDESISPEALKIVMDAMYSGDIDVNEQNVLEVLVAADHLQVTRVVQQCCDFLKTTFVHLRFDVLNFCRLFKIADRHGLTELQEAAEQKMAVMYKETCENEEFLKHIEADQLVRLLQRDDLCAPSETFVFKSVMKWINHHKEQRMADAAKVIDAVRLGLVDIRVLIEELNTEEMQRVPEIHMLVYESSLYKHMPSVTSQFAVEKAKPRSKGAVLVAIQPKTQMQYFDVETKKWKSLPSMSQLTGVTLHCSAAETVGNSLYVTAYDIWGGWLPYRYNIDSNLWETLAPFETVDSEKAQCTLCTMGDFMYVFNVSYKVPHRFSFANNQWQSVACLDTCNPSKNPNTFFDLKIPATNYNSNVYALHGYGSYKSNRFVPHGAFVHCFDPEKNEWQQKASTCHPHFGSSLFVVNNRLCVAGGHTSITTNGDLCGNPAPVEVYNEVNNTWSVVEQKHIPSNNLGAVEVEGRVYFIINKFPIDSGIRIPPGEVYPVHLGEWDKLAEISSNAALCYLPIKGDGLCTE